MYADKLANDDRVNFLIHSSSLDPPPQIKQNLRNMIQHHCRKMRMGQIQTVKEKEDEKRQQMMPRLFVLFSLAARARNPSEEPFL